MTKRLSLASGIFAVVAAALTALLIIASAPAFAGSDNGHGNSTAPGQDKKQTQDTSSPSPEASPSAASSSDGSTSNTADHSQGTSGTSGDTSSPQPASNADQNGGGANGQCPSGPYCSTRDGSPSGNGNGGGYATGKPCAGCVGKADNKNPKGQMPNGSDPNNGYECDGNNGIGKTNPAHTGCKPQPAPVCSPSTANNNCAPPVCQESAANNSCAPPPPNCQPTAANNYCTSAPPSPCVENVNGQQKVCHQSTPPVVKGVQLVRGKAGPSVAVQPAPVVKGATLPFTGANLLPYLGVALMLILLGAGTLVVRRNRA
jgi:hypothetical protein